MLSKESSVSLSVEGTDPLKLSSYPLIVLFVPADVFGGHAEVGVMDPGK